MFKIISVFFSASIVLFLAVLMIVYAFMPESAGILFNDKGDRIQEISRDTFFYATLIGFVLFQLLFYLFIVNVLNKKFNTSKKINMSIWFKGMFLAINFFFILMLIFIGLANNAIDYTFTSIEYISFLGPGLIVVWLLIFPIFYFKSK